MTERTIVKKEIHGKTKDGVKYKVKNIELDGNNPIIYGTMEIGKKEKNFQLDMSEEVIANYKFEGNKDDEDLFDSAFDNFFYHHLLTFKATNTKDPIDVRTVVKFV